MGKHDVTGHSIEPDGRAQAMYDEIARLRRQGAPSGGGARGRGTGPAARGRGGAAEGHFILAV